MPDVTLDIVTVYDEPNSPVPVAGPSEKVISGEPDSDSEPPEKKTKSDMRCFNTETYELKYTWLYYSYVKRGYVCKVCEHYSDNKQNNFVVGTCLGGHPSRRLESHQNGHIHNNATQTMVFSQDKSVNIHKLIVESHQKQSISKTQMNRDILKKLLKCTNFMVRRRWALSENFEHFVEFVAGLGDEDLLYHLETAPSKATYLSSFSVGEFLDTISMHIERKLTESLRNATDFSLLADESEDEAGREQFSLYARWQHNVDNEIGEHFLGIVHVTKTDSATLTEAIQNFFIAKGVELNKVRFLAFDGTNSMSGERTGNILSITLHDEFVFLHFRNVLSVNFI